MATFKSESENGQFLCRLCGKESANEIGIFSDTARMQDNKQLFDVNVSSIDELSQLICEVCLIEIQNCVEFKLKCEESQRCLESMLSEKNNHGSNEDVHTIYFENFDPASEWAVCRLCLDGFATLTGIFSEGEQIQEDIFLSIGVSVTLDDGLPQLICEGCFSLLQRCVQLRNKFQETRISLEGVFNTKTVPETKENGINVKAICCVNQCQICRKQLNSRRAYLVHMRAHRDGRRFVCEHCGMAFALAATLRKHLRIHNGVLPYQCEHCPYRSHVRHALTIHIRNHTGEKPYTCPYCDSAFVTSSGRAAHVSVHYRNGPRIKYSCKECPKSYVHQRSLLDHVSTTHRRLKRHKCEICEKRLSSGTSLSFHRRNVHKIKPYLIRKGRMPTYLRLPSDRRLKSEAYPTWLCDQCTNVFATERELLEHVEAKHKLQLCEVCSKTFNNIKSYRIHVRGHANGQSFICEHCGRVFAHMSSLRKHRTIHGGERPFQCPHCPYSARLKHMLLAHTRVHTKEDCGQYPCLHCASTFSNYIERSIHVLQNHPLYQCEECQKTYTKFESLADHTSAVHNKVLKIDENFIDTPEEDIDDSKGSIEKSQPDQIDNENRQSLVFVKEVITKFEKETVKQMETTKTDFYSDTLSLNSTDILDVCRRPEEPKVTVEKQESYQPDVVDNDVIDIKIQHAHATFHRCKECSQVYRESKILLQHIASVHSVVNSIGCKVCKETFCDKKSLRCHDRTVHMPNTSRKHCKERTLMHSKKRTENVPTNAVLVNRNNPHIPIAKNTRGPRKLRCMQERR